MDRNLLYNFFEGKATIDEIRVIKEWSELSDENMKQLRIERKLFDAMTLVGDEAFRRTNEKKRFVLTRWIRIAAAAAVILGIMGLASLTFFAGKQSAKYNDMAMQTITVPLGQYVQVELPDGTLAWLNSGTKMHYPLSFMGDTREVNIDGEAYFEVTPNKEKPFIVHTYFMDIEVLGTKFDVKAKEVDDVFEAALMQGKIRVKSPINKNFYLDLRPSQKVYMKDNQLHLDEVQDLGEYCWREGIYAFKNKTFIDIMKDLEEYYDVTINVENRQLYSMRLTGKFKISDGLEYTLRVLQRDISFSFTKDFDCNTINIK